MSTLRLSALAFMLFGMAACGPPSVHLRPSNSCDSSPNGLKICQDQCQAGQPRACYRLGWFYETGGEVSRSVKSAVRLYVRACDANFAVACRALGQMYWDGETVKRNPKRSIEFYRKACALGIPEACPTRAMVARSEGRRPKPGDDVALDGVVDRPGQPRAPDAPAVNGPSVPDAKTPDVKIDVPTPSL